MDFNTDKKGYCKAEVDNYINKLEHNYEAKLSGQIDRIYELKKENAELKKLIDSYVLKDKAITEALLAAIEKAKEIEDIARAKYELEAERLKIFHIKWVKYFEAIKKKYPLDDNLLTAEDFLREVNNMLKGTFDFSSKPKTIEPRRNQSDAERTYSLENKRLSKREENMKRAISDALREDSTDDKYERLLSIYNKTLNRAPESFDRKEIENNETKRVKIDYKKPNINTESPIDKIQKYYNNLNKEKQTEQAIKKAIEIENNERSRRIEKSSRNNNSSGFDIAEALSPKQTLEEICRDLGLLDD